MSQLRPLTEDALRAAFTRRQAPEGLSFEQCKRAAMHWALVAAEARGGLVTGLGTGRFTVPAPDNAVTPIPAWMGSLRVPQRPPDLDRKRAAAGERDDD